MWDSLRHKDDFTYNETWRKPHDRPVIIAEVKQTFAFAQLVQYLIDWSISWQR